MSFSGPSGSASPRSSISGYKTRQLPNFTPQQMQLFNQLLGGIGGGAGKGLDFLSQLASGDESAFTDAEAPAYSAYNRMLGQLGSRFAHLGGLESSGFQNAVSGTGADLAERLQSQRLGLRNNAIESLLGLSENLLGQRPYEYVQEKKRSGWDTAGNFADILSRLIPLF